MAEKNGEGEEQFFMSVIIQGGSEGSAHLHTFQILFFYIYITRRPDTVDTLARHSVGVARLRLPPPSKNGFRPTKLTQSKKNRRVLGRKDHLSLHVNASPAGKFCSPKRGRKESERAWL